MARQPGHHVSASAGVATGVMGGKSMLVSRRRLLLGLIFVLIVGLAFVVAVAASYARVRDQLPPLVGTGIASPPRFQSSLYGVSRPLGVAVSPLDGRVYVTESDGERETKIFDRQGARKGSLVPPDVEAANRLPVYVAVNSKGEVYVSDRTRAVIDMFAPDGGYLGQFAPNNDPEYQWSPLGLSFDSQDRLIVTDVGGGQHSVLLFSPTGGLLARYGKSGQGSDALSFPNAAVADRSGRILVSDGNNGRVVALRYDDETLSPDSRGLDMWRMGLPRGMGVDAKDRLYVVDAINHLIIAYDLAVETPTMLFSFGLQGIKDGQFSFPNGLAVEARGRIYVTDRENNRVQAWEY
ncbi:MAG: hypothetical protein EPO21_03345 [Chloroflexota bacterium]|nr:MAG: hypothetical protein EPO21_03345 [Chloroflexota bacterium]